MKFVICTAMFLLGVLTGAYGERAPVKAQSREAVTGIGGVFFKAKDPVALGAWYETHLGITVRDKPHTFHVFEWRRREDPSQPGSTVWSVFRDDTKYFGPGPAPFMINYRVRDLDAMLTQLRRGGVAIQDRVSEEFNGRFAWLSDPEGNRIELWEPKEGY